MRFGRSVILTLLMVVVPAAAAHADDFWAQVADPDRPVVESLLTRARAELDRGLPGGPSRSGAVRAVALLDEVLARRPRHFEAAFLRGDALTVIDKPEAAVAALDQACRLAETDEDEATCTLRLGVEQSRAGQYAAALTTYDQHLRLAVASSAAYGNSAEILMALGRLPEAVDRYEEAVRLEERRDAGRERDQALALGLYGLGVALDRDEQTIASAEAMSRALAIDPRLGLLDAASNRGDIFFVPAGDAHYYRGLALATLGRPREASDAFHRFLAESRESPYRARAQAHLAALAGPTAEPPANPPPEPPPVAPPGHRAWQVVAAATVKSEGPIAAPLLDAAWKGQRRLFDPCFEDVPAVEPTTVRIGIDLEIDGRGALKKVTTEAPAPWVDVPACVEKRLRTGVRFPRPSKNAPTSARLELVLARRP